jgi:hypothetical protein
VVAAQTCGPVEAADVIARVRWARPCPVVCPSSAQAGSQGHLDPIHLDASQAASAGRGLVLVRPWGGHAACLVGACQDCVDRSWSSSCLRVRASRVLAAQRGSWIVAMHSGGFLLERMETVAGWSRRLTGRLRDMVRVRVIVRDACVHGTATWCASRKVEGNNVVGRSNGSRNGPESERRVQVSHAVV